MKIMLFTNRCPMCGKVNFLKLIGKSIEELEDYTFNGGHIQDKIRSLDPFGREFIKTGYCPKCQESLFCNTCENMDQFILAEDIDTEKLISVRDGIYREIQTYEDSRSEWEEKFTQKVILNPNLRWQARILGNLIAEMRAFSRSKSIKFHIIYIEEKQILRKETD